MVQGNITPKLSVIVISFNAPTILDRCLMSLESQAHQKEIEILVVRHRNADKDESKTLKRRFRKVRWICAPQEYNVPQMRSLGIAQSQGDIVALLEDDCAVAETWCTAVLEAYQEPYVAIGGAVEPSNYAKGLDWAVYFCEYVRFMQPLPQRDVQALAGNEELR